MKNLLKHKLFYLLITHLLINSSIILYAQNILVIPPQYAFVVAKNNSGGWNSTKWGDISKWQYIVLWGRVDRSLQGKYYRWDFGDGNKSTWQQITASNYTFLSAYKNGYNAIEDADITYYQAKLEIADDSSGKNVNKNPNASVLVKAVDFGKITAAYGYEEPEKEKRLILESIAKGRGLSWLYRKQYSDGRWDGTTSNWGNRTYAGTALALCAYLIYGHSVYDPAGVKDIFTKTVNDGIYWILKNISILKTSNNPPYYSDINNDEKMCGGFGLYPHGMIMLAFAASKNKIREDPKTEIRDLYDDPDLASKYGNMTYKGFVANLVDYASYAQNDSDRGNYEGGWRYSANYYDSVYYRHADLSVTQWPVLGLAAIEDVWKIKAADFVKQRLLDYVRRAQYQTSDVYHGGGYYSNTPHSDTPSFGGTPTSGRATSETSTSRWLVGANSLLQAMFYISLTTTTATLCQCGANNCNDYKKDLTLDKNNLQNSCNRVKAAIDFIGRNWLLPGFSSSWGGPSYYTMYGIMKALRLYNYQRGGVNNGVIYEGSNFPPYGRGHQWEDEYIDFVLRDMKDDNGLGYWTGDFGTTTIATAWALLILSETIYTPGLLKTQLPKKIYEMFDEFKEYDTEIAKIFYENKKIEWVKK